MIQDYFIKRFTSFSLENQSAELIVKELQLLCSFCVPRVIYSDQGTNFESYLLKKVFEEFEIIKRGTTPYYSQGSGLVEHQIKLINGPQNMQSDG